MEQKIYETIQIIKTNTLLSHLELIDYVFKVKESLEYSIQKEKMIN